MLEPFDGSGGFAGLVLNDVEPGLDLLPVGRFPLFPDASGFGGHQQLVLCGEIGCPALWCPWVLLEEVLLGDGYPGHSPGSFIGSAFVEHQVFYLGDIRAPGTKPNVRHVG